MHLIKLKRHVPLEGTLVGGLHKRLLDTEAWAFAVAAADISIERFNDGACLVDLWQITRVHLLKSLSLANPCALRYDFVLLLLDLIFALFDVL